MGAAWVTGIAELLLGSNGPSRLRTTGSRMLFYFQVGYSPNSLTKTSPGVPADSTRSPGPSPEISELVNLGGGAGPRMFINTPGEADKQGGAENGMHFSPRVGT